MRTILLMIAELYRVEKLARERGLTGEDLRLVRGQGARPVMEKLHPYLIEAARSCYPEAKPDTHGFQIDSGSEVAILLNP
jgi:hypothetical protein